MTQAPDMEQLIDELVEAVSWAEEARARTVVSRLATQPQQARVLLEAMLEDPDAQVRQAAVFGLGEMGGAASAQRLEQQLALEEARDDYDGETVVEDIVAALGRIEEVSAREVLVRRLERLAAGTPNPGDVLSVAYALWRRRHPDLLPVVQRNLERLAPPASKALRALLVLLEKTPEELRSWARDPLVPLEHKTDVVTVLEVDPPEMLLATVPAFISEAQALVETAVRQQGDASYYCERLLSFLLSHGEQFLPTLPEESRSELHVVARKLLASVSPNCSGRAAYLLQRIGQPEDAALLEAHRPAEPMLAKAFDEAAQVLRNRGAMSKPL